MPSTTTTARPRIGMSRRLSRSIASQVDRIVQDEERMGRLLTLEKQRRGVHRDALIFVGMANVADHWWCTQRAVLKSRAEELGFFAAYLSDRILYAHRLGLVTKLPKSHKALLDVGSELTWGDVEPLLKEREREWQDNGDYVQAGQANWQYMDAAELELDPLRRGKIYHELRAEQYPTIRWHFPWGRYSVVGLPDGLTDAFAYEYKSTKSRFLVSFVKPVAHAQADLYARFSNRPNKRVQVYVMEEKVTETFEVPADPARAEDTFAAFARVDAGEPAHPPKAWKCSKCDFRAACPMSQAK